MKWIACPLLSFLVLTCAAHNSTRNEPDESGGAAETASVNPTAADADAGQTPAKRPVTLITDPTVLTALDSSGFSLGDLLFGKAGASAAELAKQPAYDALVRVLERDLTASGYRDRLSGVGLKYAHRLFDARWLRSASARFELIGVVNRLDRAVFAPAHCGETRFVFRLAYTKTLKGVRVDSRLPMTINVVAWQPAPTPGEKAACQTALRRWIPEGSATAAWLASKHGPLPQSRPLSELKSVEVNLQSVRWPATVHPSMAGHAEYVLRVFQRDGSSLVPSALENQIDVTTIRQRAPLRRELLEWLSAADHLTALDAGSAVLPERFLSKQALSVTPRGMARLANRPFSQVFSRKDFDKLDLSGRRFIRTPEELLRRLDQLTCTGCHQSRSIAGFHLLGLERRRDKKVDALAVGVSPHAVDDVAQRELAFDALAAGRPVERIRTLAERDPSKPGAWGSHCALGENDFQDWKCASGLECVTALGETSVGVCQEKQPLIGGACEVGAVTQEPNPHADRVGKATRYECKRGICEKNAVGFPGGMCSWGCDTTDPNAVCGGIAVLTDFNACLAKQTPFERCIMENTRPAHLRACDENRACRDDYVCALTPEGGGCIPPYFLFQLRVDGHPDP